MGDMFEIRDLDLRMTGREGEVGANQWEGLI